MAQSSVMPTLGFLLEERPTPGFPDTDVADGGAAPAGLFPISMTGGSSMPPFMH